MDTERPDSPGDSARKSPSSFERTMATLRNAEPRDKYARRILSGSALGVCLAIMLSMLGLPRLDQPLRVALIALAIAAPLLIQDFFFASIHLREGSDEPLLGALMFAAWIIGDGVGVGAVAVGIGAVVWHLYTPAAFVFIGTFPASFVLVWIVAFAFLFIIVGRKMRAERKDKPPRDTTA